MPKFIKNLNLTLGTRKLSYGQRSVRVYLIEKLAEVGHKQPLRLIDFML